MNTKAWKGTLRFGAGALLLGALAACRGSSVERNRSNDQTGGVGGAGFGGTAATGGASAGTTGGSAGGHNAGSGGAVGATGGSNGTAGTATGGSSGAGGAAGATGDGGEGGSPDCVPVDENPTHPDECPELERLALSDPRIDDSSGDGKVSPRERVTLRVLERDVSGLGHSGYPGVVYSTDDPNLEFVSDPEDFDLFALLSCASYESTVEIIVGDVPVDTVLHVTARAGSLNRSCPDAPSLIIPIHVQ